MALQEITDKLNELSKDYEFGGIQMYRAIRKDKPGNKSKSPFQMREKFKKEGYVFHYGGGTELQFNIGDSFQDAAKTKPCFRFGLAFSFEPSQGYHWEELLPEHMERVKRFHQFIKEHPNYLADYKYWHWLNEEDRTKDMPVQKLDKRLFTKHRFIMLGDYFKKTSAQLTEEDLHLILETFDYLLPVYKYVELGDDTAIREQRIARLCWNDKGWVLPSGPYGKSTNEQNHEGKYGYGHEEWLFDISKVIDGYHYGFLEPIRKNQEAFANNSYDVWLYSLDGNTKQRYWVGEIKGLEVLDSDTADKVKEEYIKRGWTDEMKEQIKASGANDKGFSNWERVNIFNVRFKPEDLSTKGYELLPNDHPIYKIGRYNFGMFDESYTHMDTEEEREFNTGSDVGKNTGSGTNKAKKYVRPPKAVEITYLHDELSKQLAKYLKKQHPKSKVVTENPAGYGQNRIDIVREDKGKRVFYEIKTYNNAKDSIREAFGQIIEYTFWPGKKYADEMIIVSHQPATASIRKYMKYLRDKFKMPIFYQWYDQRKEALSEKI